MNLQSVSPCPGSKTEAAARRRPYVDDIVLPGMAFGMCCALPTPTPETRSIDTAAAKAAPGVLAVLTGEDWIESGWGDLPVPGTHKRRDGSPNFRPPYPALVKDRVRCIGDYVAFVVAGTKNQATDAAELIEVDYEPLPAVLGTAEAARPGAPLVWEDCKDNICFTAIHGDKAATEAAFAKAAHVVKQHLVINRVTTASMEPRGSVGDYDAINDHYTIYTTLQRAHPYRAELAKLVLKVPEHKVRVIAPDIGGSFGMKSAIYNEVPLVLLASKLIRPAGEMDEHALRGVPVRRAGARQRHRRRARARQGRHRSSASACQLDRQRRRLPAIGLPGLHRQPRHARRRLSHARDVRGIDRGVHPHAADAGRTAATAGPRPPT